MLDKFRAKLARMISPMAYHSSTNLRHGGTRNSGAKFNNGLSSSAPHTVINHHNARQQAREKLKDSPIARGVLERFKENVIGKGLRLDPTPMAEVLGITEDEAATWADNTGRLFHLWASSKKSTIAETENFYQLQALAHFSRHRDGEYFVRFHYSKESDLQNPLKVGLVDPNQIHGDSITSSLGPFAQDDGIKRDKNGREISYKVWFQSENKPYKLENVEVPVKSKRSGRTFMLHAFTPEYAGQRRGFTRLFHVIQELENIVDYQISTLKQAINQSNIFGWTKPAENAPGSNPFADISKGIGAPDEAVTQDLIESSAIEFTYHGLDEATTNTPGGLYIANLQGGEGIEMPNMSLKGDSYAQFTDSMVSHLTPSMGMASEVMKMQFGQNYSASRGTILLQWNIFEIARDEEKSDLLDPTYESWLSEMIAAGKIQAPGWSDPVKRAAWLNCSWIGSPMPNIDPVKTAMANKHNIEMDATNPERVARELNGSDAKVNKMKNNRHFEGAELKPWMGGYNMEVMEEEEND